MSVLAIVGTFSRVYELYHVLNAVSCREDRLLVEQHGT